jgi:superfamily I DNA/RNA helicase
MSSRRPGSPRPPTPLVTAARPPCGVATGTGPRPPARPTPPPSRARVAPGARGAAPPRPQAPEARPTRALPPLSVHRGTVPREVLDGVAPPRPAPAPEGWVRRVATAVKGLLGPSTPAPTAVAAPTRETLRQWIREARARARALGTGAPSLRTKAQLGRLPSDATIDNPARVSADLVDLLREVEAIETALGGPRYRARVPSALPAQSARPARALPLPAPAAPRVRKASGDAPAAHWEAIYQEALRHGQPLPGGSVGGLALARSYVGLPAGVGLEVPEPPAAKETAAHQLAATPVGAVLRAQPGASLDGDVRLAGRNWSRYQRDVFAAIHAGAGNLVIEAVAGSGKTTTLLKALEFVASDKVILVVAFNTSIKKELSTRIPKHLTNVTVSTLAAHGNSILRRYWPDIPYLSPEGVKGDPFGKAREAAVMWAGLPSWDRINGPNVTWLLRDYEKLLDLCQAFLALTPAAIAAVREDYGLFTVKDKTGRTTEGWTYESDKFSFVFEDVVVWVQTSLAYRLQPPKGPNYARRDFERANKYAGRLYDELTDGGKTPFISLGDMTFVPAATPAMVPARLYDVIFVDETQDMSVSDLALVFRSLAPGGRIVVVGDSHQAIYRFRGADSEGMRRLRRELAATLLPLSESYRVPTCVRDEARHVVPEFQTPEGTPAGTCDTVLAVEMLRTWKAGDVVIARVNAPLVPLAMLAIQQGINPWILGNENEAAQQLNRLIADATRANPLEEGLAVLQAFLEKREQAVETMRRADMLKVIEKYRVSSPRDRERKAKALETLDEDVQADPKVVLQRLITGAFFNRQRTGLAQRKDIRTISDVRAVLKTITPSAKRVEEMSTEEYQAHMRSRLVITSVHRIKGGEANVVWVLEDTFKFTRGGRWTKKAPANDKDADEERHLWYVAVTRAKNEAGAPGHLHYVTGLKSLLGEDDAYDREDE